MGILGLEGRTEGRRKQRRTYTTQIPDQQKYAQPTPVSRTNPHTVPYCSPGESPDRKDPGRPFASSPLRSVFVESASVPMLRSSCLINQSAVKNFKFAPPSPLISVLCWNCKFDGGDGGRTYPVSSSVSLYNFTHGCSLNTLFGPLASKRTFSSHVRFG